MIPQTIGYCAAYKPTIWQRLGFGTCRAPRPDVEDEASEWAPAWHIVAVRIHLDWKDRIRTLISGNLMVESCLQTDVPIGRSKAATEIGILPPGALKR
ncbi:MAG: hypothetical protein KGL35_11915 [Bradyrhizobium sp.]|nr:hypothetical protein [Bradyrhizobium sp.]